MYMFRFWAAQCEDLRIAALPERVCENRLTDKCVRPGTVLFQVSHSGWTRAVTSDLPARLSKSYKNYFFILFLLERPVLLERPKGYRILLGPPNTATESCSVLPPFIGPSVDALASVGRVGLVRFIQSLYMTL